MAILEDMERDLTPRELLERVENCFQGLNLDRMSNGEVILVHNAQHHLARAQKMLMASYRPIEVRRGGGG